MREQIVAQRQSENADFQAAVADSAFASHFDTLSESFTMIQFDGFRLEKKHSQLSLRVIHKIWKSFFFAFVSFQALAGLVEVPAIALAMFIIMKIGKKWFFCSTIFLAGVACSCITFTEEEPHLQWLKITLLMLGKNRINFRSLHVHFYCKNLVDYFCCR